MRTREDKESSVGWKSLKAGKNHPGDKEYQLLPTENPEEPLIYPPPTIPIVLAKTKETYRAWHKYLANLNRVDRYTLGAKIDDLFCSLLELIYRSCFAHDKFEKLSLVSQAIAKNDLLKFFLQLGWEQKIVDHSQYGSLILALDETGRMLGGWKKSLDEKTPAK